jgi:hypothetical protein
MLLDGDGFEHYGATIANMLNGINAITNAVTISATKPRTGTYGLRFAPASGTTSNSWSYVRRVVPSGSRNVLSVGYAIWLDTMFPVTNGMGCTFQDTNGDAVSHFGINSDGRINAYRGTTTLLGTTVLPALVTSAWNFVEFKAARSSTVGSMAMRVNGNLMEWEGGVSSGGLLENVNTAGTANDYTAIRIGSRQNLGVNDYAPASSWLHYVDDYLVWDSLGDDNNDWVGDRQLLWRPPTADHPTIADFVPSTGTDLFAMIDEDNPSAADYIRAQLADTQAAFEYADLPDDAVDIAGIIAYVFGKKLNAGPCSVELGMLTDGIIGTGLWNATTPTIPLTTVDTFWRGIIERNPSTNLPYTPSEVDDSYFHIDRVL